MKIAIAQTLERSTKEDRVAIHAYFIEKALENTAELLVFPEMSLSNYIRDTALNESMSIDDPAIEMLHELILGSKLAVVVGLPLWENDFLYIASLMLMPDGTRQVYKKRHLHGAESMYFSAGNTLSPIVNHHDIHAGMAICVDTSHTSHVTETIDGNNCNLYLASIFSTVNGIKKTYELMKGYSREHQLITLVSNYVGPGYGTIATGRSALWDRGQLIAKLDDESEGMLVLERFNTQWNAIGIYFP